MVIFGTVSKSHADGLFSYHFGLNYFKVGADSTIGEADDSLLTLDHGIDGIAEYYFTVKHTIPLIPNLRYSYHGGEFESTTNLDQTYILNSEVFSVASTLNTRHKINVHDVLLDYSLVDLNIFRLDVGLLTRYQGLDYRVDKVGDPQVAQKNVEKWVPMLHLNAESGVPLLGFFVFAEFNEGKDDRFYQSGIGYKFDNNLLPDVDVVFGYRKEKIHFQRDDGLIFKQNLNKTFAGLEVHF